MSQKHKQPSERRGKKHKRGVILLIVVTLLTLMVLIGVTFTLFAHKSLIAAKADQRRYEYNEPPEKMFEQVLGQVLYGPSGRSSLGGHDLLGDLYGGDFLLGRLINPNGVPPVPPTGPGMPPPYTPSPGPFWGGQAYAFQFITTPTINQHSLILDYYSGRVITFIDGPAAGHSTRILQYDPGEILNPNTMLPRFPQLFIETIETDLPLPIAPNPGDSFIINGAPFNGAGAGFDAHPDKLNIDAVYGDRRSVDPANPPTAPMIAPPPTDLVALLPHFAGFDPTFGRIFTRVGVAGQPAGETFPTAGAILAGHPDESWDAVDYQNMYLAMVPPGAAQVNSDFDPTTPNLPILPSYHRPELVNYWVNFMIQYIFVAQGNFDTSDATQVDTMWRIIAQPYGPNGLRENTNPGSDDPLSNGTPLVTIDMLDRVYNITRCSIFRPMPWDHPNFTGSNPALQGSGTTITSTNAQQIYNVLRGFDINGNPANGFQNLYDVDNDNDGVRDSIWIDPGLPVVTSPDGKRYKRLFAILIQDLDGRIDMNAHGNLSQITSITNNNGTYFPYHPDEGISAQWAPPGGWGLAPLVPAGTKLPRGVGYGPAEVNFLNIFGGLYTAPNTPNNAGIFAYRQLLQSRYSSNIVGPGPTQDVGATAFAGVTNQRDLFDAIKRHGVPDDYAAQLSWYSTPPDVWGRGAIGLDIGGHPLSAFTGFTQPNDPFKALTQPIAYTTTFQINETLDNPYELTLRGQITNSDSPYTLVEIEKMLRYHDPDAQRLISRPLLPEPQGGAGSFLAVSTPGIIGPDHTNRQRLAGVTSSVPAPSAQIPHSRMTVGGPNWRLEMLTSVGKTAGNTTLLDLYAARIRASAGITAEPMLSRVLNQLMPWEIRHGGKLDINRWLGDGFDSTAGGDGVADDPLEAFADPANPAPFNVPPFNGPRENGWQSPPAPTSYQNMPAEHSNGSDVNLDGRSADTPLNPPQVTAAHKSLDRMLARQLYCRHLFCLAMLFLDPSFDPQLPHEPLLAGAGAAGQRRQLFARRIAQWAVNVVDARDSDSIMTAFEYDENPWNGWDVDSDLLTNARSSPPPTWDAPEQIYDPVAGTMQQITHDFRGVVWGVENPELLISETMAFHSRNVKDTANDNDRQKKRDDTNMEDLTLDQFRVPQGSLFVELYNTRSGRFAGQTVNQKARYPLELYDINGNLMLGKVAPGGWPVWRLAISELSNQGSNNSIPDAIKPNQIVNSSNQLRESASFEPTVPASMGLEPPRNISMVRASQNPPVMPLVTLPLERFVWFTTPAFATGPANSVLHDYSFYSNSNAMPLVQPGQYAIVGPRLVTYIGSRDSALTTDPNYMAGSLWGGYSPQRLEFNGNGLTVYDADVTAVPPGNATTANYGTQIRNAVGIIADIDRTTLDPASMPPRAIMSPLGPWTQMPQWNIGLNITEPLPRQGAGGTYYPEPTPPPLAAGIPLDFYDDPDPTLATTLFPDEPQDSTANRPLQQHNMIATRTYTDVASVYLQRLANPNLPWNALGNPYITVDWAAIDVSVFAGDENTNRQVNNSQGMQDVDLDDPTMGRPQIKWATRQRGRPVAAPNDALVWVPTTLDPPDAGQVNTAGGELYFDISLTQQRHTFPYLNRDLGVTQGPPYLGELAQNPNPFPWLVHLDRPFASPMELLQVSSSAPNRLFYEFTPGEMGAYLCPNIYNAADPLALRSPFYHLLSFFHSDANGSTSPQLQRLLDSVEVPSRYCGTERYYNPTYFSAAPPASTGLYRAPFNKLSRFRDPGQININTIFDREVWNAAVGSHPHLTRPAGNPVDGIDIVDNIFRSRQGYGGSGQLLQMNPDVPTFFANPFRPLDAGDLMPNVPMVGPNTALSMRLDGIAPHRMSVEGTFMRPDPDINPDRVPLFDHRVPTTPDHVYHHTGRNAYFRHQALQKLGNTFTTRSNVFAVWMTVGYFEVEDNTQTVNGTNVPNLVNAAHPDGLRLGQEIGADSGEIVRHRAFYMIDRSIPAGYAPGQKLNAENCVLLRRMIE